MALPRSLRFLRHDVSFLKSSLADEVWYLLAKFFIIAVNVQSSIKINSEFMAIKNFRRSSVSRLRVNNISQPRSCTASADAKLRVVLRPAEISRF